MNIYAQLAEAQGKADRFAEAKLMPEIARLHGPKRSRGGAANGVSRFDLFTQKIACGLSDCWYWVGAGSSNGRYGCFRAGGKHGKHMGAHRAAWEIFKGEIPKGMHVLHRCDVPSCVNPDHLFLGTHKENMDDRAAKGRLRVRPMFGEKNGNAKLTLEKVEQMRLARADGQSVRLIAEKFGVGVMAARNAIVGKTWR